MREDKHKRTHSVVWFYLYKIQKQEVLINVDIRQNIVTFGWLLGSFTRSHLK